MASDYNSDDTFNVIEDHLIQALQADAKLGTGGALEVATWEQEHRNAISGYNENELPAISVEVGIAPAELLAIGDRMAWHYPTGIYIVITGGTLAYQKQTVKYFAARVVRVLQQQHYPDKQLVSLPDDLDGADTGDVMVNVEGVEILAGAPDEERPNVLRGYAVISADISVTYVIPED